MSKIYVSNYKNNVSVYILLKEGAQVYNSNIGIGSGLSLKMAGIIATMKCLLTVTTGMQVVIIYIIFILVYIFCLRIILFLHNLDSIYT